MGRKGLDLPRGALARNVRIQIGHVTPKVDFLLLSDTSQKHFECCRSLVLLDLGTRLVPWAGALSLWAGAIDPRETVTPRRGHLTPPSSIMNDLEQVEKKAVQLRKSFEGLLQKKSRSPSDIWQIDALMEERDSIREQFLRIVQAQRWYAHDHQIMLHAMAMQRERICTNPRDYVYGYSGLAPSYSAILYMDYSFPVEKDLRGLRHSEHCHYRPSRRPAA